MASKMNYSFRVRTFAALISLFATGKFFSLIPPFKRNIDIYTRMIQKNTTPSYIPQSGKLPCLMEK